MPGSQTVFFGIERHSPIQLLGSVCGPEVAGLIAGRYL